MKDFLMFGEDRSIYNEIPVDIDTFIEDDYYLGKSTNNGKTYFLFGDPHYIVCFMVKK